ncbi:hypothetical protein ACQJBY_068620 [Aegilops geniculata]
MGEKRRAKIKVPFGSDVNLACMNNFRSQYFDSEVKLPIANFLCLDPRQITKRKGRRQGMCPLTPNEVGLLLGALGHRSNVHIYAACSEVKKILYLPLEHSFHISIHKDHCQVKMI